MSLEDHTYFLGVKSYADLIVQEYGKNVGLKTACFRATYNWSKSFRAKLHGFCHI